MSARGAAIVAAALLCLAACGKDEAPVPAAAPGAGDPARGRQVWLAQCVACHNVDPAKDGPVGPAVKGSSRELVDARVVQGAYPPGYKPKRDSKVMPPRPDLAPRVPDLTAFLTR